MTRRSPTKTVAANGIIRRCAKSAMPKRRRSEQAGVEVTAYAYRRAFAARLIAAGVSIEDVAGLLGNTTTVALRAYVDLTAQSERLKEAAKRG